MAKHISVITCLFMMMISSCVAVDFSVGDWAGWTLDLNYPSWIADKTFHVGDNLAFKYSTEHTVAEVSVGEYTSCTLENSISTSLKKSSTRKTKKNKSKKNKIRSRDKSDTTIITLETPGTHYFICVEPGHCAAGMKLAINVSAEGESATPPPTCNDCHPLAPPNGSSNIQPSTNNSLPGAQPSNVTAPLAQIPPYKKSGSARAGLSNVPPFVVAVLLALVLL